MTTEELKVKIQEEEKALNDLEIKKKKIEDRISIKKKKIEDYRMIVQTRQYTDIDNQLDSLGVTREDLLEALANGDLNGLQNRILNHQEAATNAARIHISNVDESNE